MKYLFACLAVMFMVAPAMAGEDPYISIVGTDCVPGTEPALQGVCEATNADPFYYSPKYAQFMYNENAEPFFIPAKFGTFPPVNQYTRQVGDDTTPPFDATADAGKEQFRSKTLNYIPDPCRLDAPGALSAKTPAGNVGFYEWFIRVPKKPDGEINIAIQCGIVKPNAYIVGVEGCAAETGERLGFGLCVRQEVDAGVSPVNQAALPTLTAIAYPGPYSDFTPFNLTAFKNPSAYTLTFDAATGAINNSGNAQVLNGSTAARVLLKACMDKVVLASCR